jgi:glutamine amidotransferase-like uncharacterized protein
MGQHGTRRFARALGAVVVLLTGSMVAAADAKAPTTAPAAGVLRVAIYDDGGGSQSGTTNVSQCLTTTGGGFKFKAVKAEDIRAGVLKDYDVLVQPGGSGSKQAAALGDEGRETVRTFVRNGGGYVGICAGSYLSTTDYTWSLGLLNAKVLDRKHWARGTGPVQIRLTEAGKKFFGATGDGMTVYYGQGPLLSPDDKADLPAYEPLAVYESEIAKNGAPSGVMIGTTAIATTPFGKGRVICFSPHLEKNPEQQGLIRLAIRWAGGAGQGGSAAAAAAAAASAGGVETVSGK